MLRFAVELVPCLLLGLLLGRRFPLLPARLSPPLIHWGVPISLVGLLLRAGTDPQLLTAGTMAALVTALGLLPLRRCPPLRRLLPAASLQLGSVTGNTAYWGLPVALALLPPRAIGYTITYDLVGTLITWSFGPLLLQGVPARMGALLAAIGSSPASRGLGITLLLELTPWSHTLAGWLWWPARLVILLALAVVGMRLGVMLGRWQPEALAPTGLRLALVGKLLVLPAMALGLAVLLRLSPLLRDAVVLQAAAPTAISVLLLAEVAAARSSQGGPPMNPGSLADVEAAAGLVLGSTVLALATVPLWWLALRALPG